MFLSNPMKDIDIAIKYALTKYIVDPIANIVLEYSITRKIDGKCVHSFDNTNEFVQMKKQYENNKTKYMYYINNDKIYVYVEICDYKGRGNLHIFCMKNLIFIGCIEFKNIPGSNFVSFIVSEIHNEIYILDEIKRCVHIYNINSGCFLRCIHMPPENKKELPDKKMKMTKKTVGIYYSTIVMKISYDHKFIFIGDSLNNCVRMHNIISGKIIHKFAVDIY